MISLQVVTESEFFADLEKRGFKLTNIRESNLRVCMYNGHAYTLPVPLYVGKPEKKEETMYCPFGVQLFYDHVNEAESAIETDEHGQVDYNVVDISKHKD